MVNYRNCCSNDNYSCKVTFAKAHTLKPLYMRVLKTLIDHPNGLRRHEVLNLIYNLNFLNAPNGWLIGPFLLLKGNGFAAFERRGHHCYWKATAAGEAFYNVMRVNKDLLAEAA